MITDTSDLDGGCRVGILSLELVVNILLESELSRHWYKQRAGRRTRLCRWTPLALGSKWYQSVKEAVFSSLDVFGQFGVPC